MTRRIAAAILLTCWAILLLGGAASYWSVRRVLLAELDDSLVLRASSLPEVLGIRNVTGAAALPAGDRYVIKNHLGQTLARPAGAEAEARPAEVLAKSFATLGDGARARTITLSFPETVDGEAMTVIYSGSAERFDGLLWRLTWVLLGVAVCAGAIVAAVAVRVAHVALRPLRTASAMLGSIDDKTLDRRLDVTSMPAEIRPIAGRMNQLLARLEQGLGERKRFLADAAHELRTPVTAMTTSIEVALRRPRGEAMLTRTLGECLTDARLLRRLVEALLEQFRTDNNPAAQAFVVEDVSALLDLSADALETAARLKGVKVIRSYPAGLRFETQPDRLRSVAGNLLANGIEYNVEGGELEVNCDVTEAGLQIVVRDTGVGISEADRPHVFEPFYRTKEARAAMEGHAGLGLYLVKSHVEALGGTVCVDSKMGKGTEFRVVLPPRPYSGMGRKINGNRGLFSLASHAKAVERD